MFGSSTNKGRSELIAARLRMDIRSGGKDLRLAAAAGSSKTLTDLRTQLGVQTGADKKL